jgi:chromosome partitioning protein
LLSKVDASQTSSAPIVRAWAQRAYGEWLHTQEVPVSSVMSIGALAFYWMFDIGKWEGSAKTFNRIREPPQEYARWVDEQVLEQKGI